MPSGQLHRSTLAAALTLLFLANARSETVSICYIERDGTTCKAHLNVCGGLVAPCGAGFGPSANETICAASDDCKAVIYGVSGARLLRNDTAVSTKREETCHVTSSPISDAGGLSGVWGHVDVATNTCPMVRYSPQQGGFPSGHGGFPYGTSFKCYVRADCTGVLSVEANEAQPEEGSDIVDAILFFSISAVVIAIMYGITRIGLFSSRDDPVKEDPPGIDAAEGYTRGNVTSDNQSFSSVSTPLNGTYNAPVHGGPWGHQQGVAGDGSYLATAGPHSLSTSGGNPLRLGASGAGDGVAGDPLGMRRMSSFHSATPRSLSGRRPASRGYSMQLGAGGGVRAVPAFAKERGRSSVDDAWQNVPVGEAGQAVPPATAAAMRVVSPASPEIGVSDAHLSPKNGVVPRLPVSRNSGGGGGGVAGAPWLGGRVPSEANMDRWAFGGEESSAGGWAEAPGQGQPRSRERSRGVGDAESSRSSDGDGGVAHPAGLKSSRRRIDNTITIGYV